MIMILSWVLSVTSAIMLWLMGSKSKWGPRLGLMNQVLWLVYAILLRQWGLIPGVLLYTIVHLRNLVKWQSPGGINRIPVSRQSCGD